MKAKIAFNICLYQTPWVRALLTALTGLYGPNWLMSLYNFICIISSQQKPRTMQRNTVPWASVTISIPLLPSGHSRFSTSKIDVEISTSIFQRFCRRFFDVQKITEISTSNFNAFSTLRIDFEIVYGLYCSTTIKGPKWHSSVESLPPFTFKAWVWMICK